MIEIQINNTGHKQSKGGIISVACRFKSEIIAEVNEQRVNAKSIMNAPIIDTATNIRIIISGMDEKIAAKAIQNYFDIV